MQYTGENIIIKNQISLIQTIISDLCSHKKCIVGKIHHMRTKCLCYLLDSDKSRQQSASGKKWYQYNTIKKYKYISTKRRGMCLFCSWMYP